MRQSRLYHTLKLCLITALLLAWIIPPVVMLKSVKAPLSLVESVALMVAALSWFFLGRLVVDRAVDPASRWIVRLMRKSDGSK